MDLIRQHSVFAPDSHVHAMVIGVGALGGQVALQLAKLGVENGTVMDPDVVENHNLCNQVLYGPDDVGHHKALRAVACLQRLTGARWSGSVLPLTERTQLRHPRIHLFVCVDSMAARRTIFDQCAFLNPRVEYYCEARMHSRGGAITAFDPRDPRRGREYQRRWYPDEEVPSDVGTCGNVLSIGCTASLIASHMAWHYVAAHGAVRKQTHWEELALDAERGQIHHQGFL